MRFFLLIISLMIGCGRENQSERSDEQHVLDAYVELLVLHEKIKTNDSAVAPSQYTAEVQAIVKRHGIQDEELRREILSLSDSPERLQQFYQKVSKRLEEQRAATPR
jgi:hypothetical protein